MANDGSVSIGVLLDESGFRNSINNLGSVAKKGMSATVGAIGAASFALAGFGLAGLKVGAEFEAAMSQVGATMGMSAEEIRNGSKEFAMLEKAAMDAGKSTQFSAKQSAEALNYLALAGYSANKSVEALPVVLNLAAAGGLDLAYASDLVTDSMSALGLQTSELSGFTDELAKTSQKSNTSVAQLGEGILTVGGTAKNLAGGTVELNTALGIFADNGIKGAEGGTALRNIILALSAPTDIAAKKMSELGVEAFDADGNMRPLNETFKDLDSALGGLTQEGKMNALSTIFNNRDLKSATALLANSGQRFDELSGYIENADGAAAQMAITMNDNLKGAITILKSSLEGLGIAFYKGVDAPVKDVVNSITGMIGGLTSALESGGLEGLVNKIGKMFSDIVLKVSLSAPKMIDAAVDLINSFLKGIADNSARITKGGINIGKSLLEGIKSVTVGFADAIGQAVPMLKPFTEALKFTVANLEYVAIAIGTAVLAFKSLAIIASIQKLMQAFALAQLAVATATQTVNAMFAANALQLVAVNGGLTMSQALVAGLTGKLGLVTAAQSFWNAAMAANPIGAVVTVVATLVAGLAILVVATNKANEAEIARKARIEETILATEELTSKMNDVSTAYDNSVSSIQSAADADLVQLGYVKELTDELTNLADENGNVDEANKGRAAFILGELNTALNTEYQMIGNQIMGYGEMEQSIYDLIKAEEARIALTAHKEMLVEAIKAEVEARKLATTAIEEMGTQQEEQTVTVGKFIDHMEKTKGVLISNEEAAALLSKGWSDLGGTGNNLAKEYVALDTKIEENTKVVEASGAAAIEVANSREAISKASIAMEAKNYDEVSKILASEAINRKEIQSKSGLEIAALIEENSKAIKTIEEEKAKATTVEAKKGWDEQLKVAAENGTILTEEYKKAGGFAVQGLADGMKQNKILVTNVATEVATAAVAAFKNSLIIKSPSKVMRDEVGKPISAGMAVGIKENKNLVTDAAKELSQKTVESFKGVLDSMIQNSADMVNAVDDNGKKLYKTQDDINKKLYSQAKEFINLKQEQNQLSAEDELDLWKYVGANFALSTKEQIEVEKNKNKAMETLAKELEQIEKDRFDNSKKWIDNKKKLNELSLAEEYQAWQNIQSQYAQGTDYRIQADEQFFRVKSEIISKIDKLEEDYSKAVESRTQQIFNAYSLFEKIEIKEPINAQEVYDSLEQQLVAFEEWSNNLKILSKRGIDEGLLAELEEAGPKMNREITALTTMSEAQWTEYNKMFVEKRKLANEQATKELAPLQKETQKGIADLVKGIESEFDKGKNIGTSFMDNLSKGIKDNAPKVLEAISKIAEGVIKTPNLFFGADALITALNEAGNNMSKGLGEQIDAFEKWNQSIEGLSSKTINEGLLPDLEQSIPQASEFIAQLNEMTEKGLTTYSKIFKEKSKLARELMMGELSQLHNEASRKTADIIRGIENEFSKSPAVGLNMAQGLANGIRSGMSEVINAAIEVAQEAIRAAKEELDINSPSKVFEEIGGYVAEGFADGINDNLDTVDDAISNMKDAAELKDSFDIKLVSDDLYSQGKLAGNDFFEGFTEALKKIDLVVNSTLSNMVPQFAVSGAGSPMNSMVTNNSSNVVQNFYSQTVSPYDVYRKAVLNALR